MKVGYLVKKRDACYYIRVLTVSSHLVLHGHEVREELLEFQGYCQPCGGQNMLEYHFFTDGDFKCPKCQVLLPFDHDAWKENVMSIIEWSDILVFQRTTDLDHLRLMKMAQDMGKPVVLEGDDDYINVPLSNPGFGYYAQRQPLVKEMFRIANAVTVTTEGLKKVYSEFNDNIAVIPNCNDIEVVDCEPPLPTPTCFVPNTLEQSREMGGQAARQVDIARYEEARVGKKVIGWGGSPTHEKDLEIIIPALKKLLRREDKNKILFSFVGYVHKAFLEIIPKDQLFLFGLVPVTAYFMLYKKVRFDIGLAPVYPFQFNEGKSANKLHEYQILKVLPVVSDFVTYRNDIHQGFLASPNHETLPGGKDEVIGSEYGWFRAISNAINCENTEERLLANRKYVEENYDIKTKIHVWIEFFQKVIDRKV